MRSAQSKTGVVLGLIGFGWGLLSIGCASPGGRVEDETGEVGAVAMHRMAADRALQAGRFDEAVKAYTRLIESGAADVRDTAVLHHKLAMALWKRGGRVDGGEATEQRRDEDRRAAIEHCTQALEGLDTRRSPALLALYATVGRTLGGYLREQGQVDQAIAHYGTLLETLPEFGEDRARTLYGLSCAHLQRSQSGRYLNAPGVDDLTEASRHLQAALGLARGLEAPPADLLVMIHNATGLVHNQRWQPGVAAEAFADALTRCRQAGPESLEAQVLENLITALIESGQTDEARQRCQELEALPEATTDPRTMAALGVAYLSLGDLARSRQQFDLARYLTRQEPGTPDDPTFEVQLACNAAAAAQAVGAYDEAERLLLDAQSGSGEHAIDARTSAVVQANLGRMYLSLERLDDADRQLNRALERLRTACGPRHPDTLLVLGDLANLARSRGYMAEAKALCEQAVRGLLSVRGGDHPDVAAARLELASVLSAQGNCPDALNQARQAMASLDARFGTRHKRAVTACLRTALIALDCEGDGADPAETRALTDASARRFAALRDALGAGNLEVLRAVVSFADVSARVPAGYASALARYREAEEGFARVYGDTTKSLAALRLKEGRVLERMRRYDEAMQSYERALRLMDRSLLQRPIHAELLAAIGDVHAATGHRDMAMQPWREALRILTASYGRDHPRVRRFKASHLPPAPP